LVLLQKKRGNDTQRVKKWEERKKKKKGLKNKRMSVKRLNKRGLPDQTRWPEGTKLKTTRRYAKGMWVSPGKNRKRGKAVSKRDARERAGKQKATKKKSEN